MFPPKIKHSNIYYVDGYILFNTVEQINKEFSNSSTKKNQTVFYKETTYNMHTYIFKCMLFHLIGNTSCTALSFTFLNIQEKCVPAVKT